MRTVKFCWKCSRNSPWMIVLVLEPPRTDLEQCYRALLGSGEFFNTDHKYQSNRDCQCFVFVSTLRNYHHTCNQPGFHTRLCKWVAFQRQRFNVQRSTPTMIVDIATNLKAADSESHARILHETQDQSFAMHVHNRYHGGITPVPTYRSISYLDAQ